MKSKSNVDKVMQSTQRYWYEDGFQDLTVGGWMIVLGLAFMAQSLTPSDSPLGWLWSIGMPILLIGGGLVAGWAVNRLKSRVTYPRTGYVSYERQNKGLAGKFRLLVAALVAAAVAAGIVVIQNRWVNLTTIFGFLFMAVWGLVAYRFGLRRYLLLALWSLALGLGLAPLALTLDQGSAIFFVGSGAAMMLAGWFTWREYDRNAPPAPEANDAAKS